MSDGYAEVQNKNGESNFINSNYSLIWDEWRKIVLKKEYGRPYFREGIAVIVTSNNLFNYLNIETGEVLMSESQSQCEVFFNGYGKIKNHMGQFNIVDKSGNILFNTWYYGITILKDDWFGVKVNPDEGVALIDKEGNIVSDKRWKSIIFFDGKYGCVQEEGNSDEYILINSDFEEVLRTNKCIICFSYPNDTFLVISLEASFSTNVLTIDGKLLLPDGLTPDVLNQSKQYITLKDSDNIAKYKINNDTGEITEL
jgi:hypothetical protein